MTALLSFIITAGFIAMFLPLLAKPTTLAFFGIGDSWKYTGPVQHFIDSSLHSGHFPFWNPLIFCGQPIAGNPQYLLFYPPNLLRSLLTPAPTPWRTHVGLAVLYYLHTLFAAYGTYLLARRFKMSRLAALAAGIVFAFSAAFTVRLFNHLHIVFVASYIPWLFLGLSYAMQSTSWRVALSWYVITGLTYGMALLAGFPQVAFVAGFSLVVYYLVARIADLVAFGINRPASFRTWSRIVSRDVSLGFVAVFAAVGLASALLIPALELTKATYRGDTNASYFLPLFTRGPRWNVAELLSIYLGSPKVEGFKAAGASALVLSALGLFSLQRRVSIVLAVFTVLMIDACRYHSWFVGDVLHFFAPFPFGSPARGMVVTVLPIALLAGLGVDRLSRITAGHSGRGAASVLCTITALTALALIFRRTRIEGGSISAISYEALAFPAATLGLALCGLWSRHGRTCAAMSVLVLAAEPVYSRYEYMKNTSLPYYQGSVATAKSAGEFWNTNSREVIQEPEPETTNTGLYTVSGQINGYDPISLHGVRDLMAPRRSWRGAYFHHVGVRDLAVGTNRANLLLKRAFWLQRNYVRGPIPENAISFPPTSTSFLSGTVDSGMTEVPPDQVPNRPYSDTVSRIPILDSRHEFVSEDGGRSGALLRLPLPSATARKHSVLSLTLNSDCSASLEVYIHGGPDGGSGRLISAFPIDSTRGGVRVIEIPLPDGPSRYADLVPLFVNHSGRIALERAEVVIDEMDENSLIRVVSRSANQVDVELVNLPSARILTFTDFMYPGWHVYVDGKETDLLTAYSYFKAVAVNAGTHRVRFVFRPITVYAGIAVSALTIVASAFLIVFGLRRP